MILKSPDEMEPESSLKDTYIDTIILSDLEEGEIFEVNDLDDVSDISSEEEYLLWQRIKILEKFNTALEEKEAKKLLSSAPEHLIECTQPPLSLSGLLNNEASARVSVKAKTSSKTNKTVRTSGVKRKKKSHNSTKKVASKVVKKISPRSYNVSSDSETDAEVAISKRKLQEAVRIPSSKSGAEQGAVAKSSLKERLFTMLNGANAPSKTINLEHTKSTVVPSLSKIKTVVNNKTNKLLLNQNHAETIVIDDDTNCISDDDPEILRNLALKSQTTRNNLLRMKDKVVDPVESVASEDKVEKAPSEELDSDTEALRIIALKSAMLNKTIVRKKSRQGKRKVIRRSISSIFSDDGLDLPYLSNDENRHGTDIEAVDMEIDADKSDGSMDLNTQVRYNMLIPPQDPYFTGDVVFPNNTEYQKTLAEGLTYLNNQFSYNEYQYYDSNNYLHRPTKHNETIYGPLECLENKEDVMNNKSPLKEEEIDEDEDILRAQLLTAMGNTTSAKEPQKNAPDKSLVIKLGESDSGSEYEATENLKKMHFKLAQQSEFQKSLENFLKDARLKSENEKLSKEDIKSSPATNTPMAVRHLPISAQEEYRVLVKRIAELEKNKLSRQKIQNIKNNHTTIAKLQTSKLKQNVNDINMNKELSLEVQKAQVLSARIKNGETINNVLKQQTDKNNCRSKVIENQLTLSRQKITTQMKLLQELKNEEKGLQEKTESLAMQVRALAAALRGSRSALTHNQRSLHLVHRNLVRLRKQHHILLSRSKNTLIKEPVSNSLNSVPANNKNMSSKVVLGTKINQIKSPSGKRIVMRKSENLPPQEEQSRVKHKKSILGNIDEMIKDSIIVQVMNDQMTDGNQDVDPNSSVISSKMKDVLLPKQIPPELNSSETTISKESVECKDINKTLILGITNNEVTTGEYESPIQFMKNDHTGSEDSQAIFCPFEVGGSCKDPQCEYFHPTK